MVQDAQAPVPSPQFEMDFQFNELTDDVGT